MHSGYKQIHKLRLSYLACTLVSLWFIKRSHTLNVIQVLLLSAGLTALRSDEVIDLMIKEYPSKHSEYSVILQERERQRIAKEYSVSKDSKNIL